MNELIDQVMQRIGMDTRQQAEAAIRATLTALGERLAPVESKVLAETLPDALRVFLQVERDAHADFAAADLYARVSEITGVNPARAMEEVRVVCQIMAEKLDSEGFVHMQRLPADVAALFVPRPHGRTPEPMPHHPAEVPGHGHTLAGGRAGSAHPVSEAAPSRAHSESVAQAENPHEQGKLASTPGAAQRGEDLATGKPGSKRPLSEGD